MCFGCSKEQSHQDGSFEYTKHLHLHLFSIKVENNVDPDQMVPSSEAR